MGDEILCIYDNSEEIQKTDAAGTTAGQRRPDSDRVERSMKVNCLLHLTELCRPSQEPSTASRHFPGQSLPGMKVTSGHVSFWKMAKHERIDTLVKLEKLCCSFHMYMECHSTLDRYF